MPPVVGVVMPADAAMVTVTVWPLESATGLGTRIWCPFTAIALTVTGLPAPAATVTADAGIGVPGMVADDGSVSVIDPHPLVRPVTAAAVLTGPLSARVMTDAVQAGTSPLAPTVKATVKAATRPVTAGEAPSVTAVTLAGTTVAAPTPDARSPM